MVFTVQVLRNQEILDTIPGSIESVKIAIRELNEQVGSLDASVFRTKSVNLSRQINALKKQQIELEEENAFLIKQLGFNPIDELDTLREEQIIIEEQLPITQDNTLRNALIVGGAILLIA